MSDFFPMILSVEPIADHTLRVEFNDGSFGIWEADLTEFFGSVGEPLRDPQEFAKVFVQNGALYWPCGFDAAPDALYDRLDRAGKLHRPQAAE